ncbi:MULTISPECIES: CDP-alcohol phosphatidyltransferase family protein [unclassified Frankia]|uniref:CDP-alcohol phosphatidyltransferase family protein n=1 Tax=unclassified Frankia TaxID=2632575 RepID=UPI001EE42BE5|nr:MULTISPECIES: CDP-alcohol phosphatidyltransferase family protein [unclassified Frankia]
MTSAPVPSGDGSGGASAPPGGRSPGGEPVASDRILTIPNLLSTLRLVGVPVFLWVALGPRADWVALGILMFAGVSDYLDGRLARALNQTSRLGALLDPLADRLYILATIVALTVRGNIPWWLTAIIIGRDVFITLLLVPMRRLGLGTALPVHYLGKAATFNLLYAFPLLLLANGHGWLSTGARPLGWAFAIWGTAMYWWAGLLYAFQVAGIARDRRRGAGGGRPAPAGGSP